jgi:hypothetical protein
VSSGRYRENEELSLHQAALSILQVLCNFYVLKFSRKARNRELHPKHVFTFGRDSHNSTVIDPEKQSVITTIDLVGKVEFPAVDGKGMLYDNNPEKKRHCLGQTQ